MTDVLKHSTAAVELQPSGSAESKRLRSLDALRGFDMFWIIGGERLVHGFHLLTGWPIAAWASNQLTHAPWHGFTLYDLIFPLFIFISGAAFSYSSARADVDRSAMRAKVMRRAMILVALGIVYNNGLFRLAADEMRYPSVLGRIGLAYLIGGFAVLHFSRRTVAVLAPATLIGYWLLLLFVPFPGVGPDRFEIGFNLVGAIDQRVLPGTLLLGGFDPEGLLSTLAASVNFLAGVMAADVIRSRRTPKQTLYVLGLSSVIAILVAMVWHPVFPINKNLWTSSFVCLTVGLSLMLLLVGYLAIDVWKPPLVTTMANPFVAIGRNAILIYMAPLFINFEYLTDFFFAGGVNRIADPAVLFMAWSMGYVAIKVAALMWLDRKKIYLRL